MFAAVLGFAGGCAEISAEEGTAEHALAAGLTTDKATYLSTEQVAVSFSDMSGAQTDWIAIAQASDPDNVYTAYRYTEGATSGMFSFGPLPAGSYEARAYFDWNGTESYAVQARAAFTVTNPPAGVTLTTSATAYTPTSSIIVNYTGLAGTSTDWVAIALPGSAPTDFLRYVYTDGSPSGSVEFGAGLANGTYVARSFNSDSFEVVAQSAEFAVGNIVSTSQTQYMPGAQIDVHFQGLPASPSNWVAIAAQGAPGNSFVAYQYVSTASGQVSFGAVPAGIYEARVFLNDSYTIHAASTFTVAAPAAADISTGAASYEQGDSVDVTYTFTGNPMDWVGIAVAGSPDTSFISYVYVNGAGTAQFNSIGLAPGNYEARLYANDGYVVQDRTTFAITAAVVPAADVSTTQATYTTAEAVVVNYTSLGGSQDWIGIAVAGSPDTAFVQFAYTNGVADGQLSFEGLPAGSYEARAYRADSFVVEDRTTFDVQ